MGCTHTKGEAEERGNCRKTRKTKSKTHGTPIRMKDAEKLDLGGWVIEGIDNEGDGGRGRGWRERPEGDAEKERLEKE